MTEAFVITSDSMPDSAELQAYDQMLTRLIAFSRVREITGFVVRPQATLSWDDPEWTLRAYCMVRTK